ncbi:MAG: leucyl aminopeptidase [Candidatus Sericytochromatia bacterium]|nr:leucyl aminopeptidase [Candidatus Sericytochromatia bacterium]
MIFSPATSLDALSAEALLVFLQVGQALPSELAAWDQAHGGTVAAVLGAGDFTGKVGSVVPIWLAGAPVRRVVLTGLGEEGTLDLEGLRAAAGEAARLVQDLGHRRVGVLLPTPASLGWEESPAPTWAATAEAVAEGMGLATFRYKRTRPDPEEPQAGLETAVPVAPGSSAAEVDGAVARALAVVACIDLARTWIVRPGNDLTPARWAEETRAEASRNGLTVEVFDEHDLKRRGFRAILAVARGSEQPPRMMVVHHRGGEANEPPVVIVGKGVTFDSGGIGIKPSQGMERMKYDMAGGAAALAIVLAAARLGLPVNVTAVVPAVENMPDAGALVPNEIITTYDGLTIEVNDTDAEGRVILADAIAYGARDLGARAIVDMATLTGAIGIALGREYAGVMGTHPGLVRGLLEASRASGEGLWELPLGPAHQNRFDEALRSDLADMLNYPGREASAITAAAFLKPFAGGRPWAHLDIAGVGWSNAARGHRIKGPTGAPVRTVLAWLAAGAPLAPR